MARQTLIAREIPTLINGVSQQHPQFRMPSQSEEQVNISPSLVHGLRPRKPIEYVKLLDAESPSALRTFTINRGKGEKYLGLFAKNTVKVFGLDGTAKTVSTPSGVEYITTAKPYDDLTTTTVADYTFVVNRNKTVTRTAASAVTRPKEVLVHVKVANYLTDYKVTVNGTTATTSTPSGVGTVDNPPPKISTTSIATELRNALATALTGFTITVVNSTIWIKKTDGSAFTASIADSRGDTQLFLINDTVQHFSDLPTVAPDGFRCKVVGDVDEKQDDYYIRFQTTDGTSFGQGIWVETVKEGLQNGFTNTTMPHAIIHEADGTFTFKPLDWAARTAGDDDSCPPPSFAGRKISDIFFYRNRLGVLSDDNVIMSRAGDFFSWWNETALTITDGDPIDYSASHDEVSLLKYAVTFQEALLLFGEKNQFVLDSPDILSPSTAVITHVSPYSIDPDIRPVAGSKTLFYCSGEDDTSTGATRVKEFYIDSDHDRKESADITAHVPKYIPENITRLVSTPDREMLFLLPSTGTELYVYKYYWSGTDKIQSAWFKYTLPPGCLCRSIELIGDTLYLFNEYAGALHLEKLLIDTDAVYTETVFDYCLDRQITSAQCTKTYDSVTDETLVTLPFPVDTSKYTAVETNTGILVNSYPGPTSSQLIFEGDYRTIPFTLGYLFERTYTFSEQFLKSSTTENAATTTGRLQYRNWTINYGLSGTFNVDVVPKDLTPYEGTEGVVMSSAMIGTTMNGIGQAVLAAGQLRAPVHARSDRVTVRLRSDSHLPFTVVSAAWEGRYVTKNSLVR